MLHNFFERDFTIFSSTNQPRETMASEHPFDNEVLPAVCAQISLEGASVPRGISPRVMANNVSINVNVAIS